MLGLLRIRSAIVPFRRGGLTFTSTRDPLEISITELTGDQLHALIHDPNISIEIADQDGTYRTPPLTLAMAAGGRLDEFLGATAEYLQTVIDQFDPPEGEDGDRPDGGADIDPDESRVADLEARIASLIEQGEKDHAGRVEIMAERDRLAATLTEMTERATNAEGQVGDLLNKIVALKDQVAALTPTSEPDADHETAPVDPPASTTDKAPKKPKASAPAPA